MTNRASVSGGGGLTVGTSLISGGAAFAVLREDSAQKLAAFTNLTFGAAAAGTGLAIVAGTAVAASVAAFSLTRTNNNALVDTGAVLNYTDTLSAATFTALDIQYAGTSYVSVGKKAANGTVGTAANYGLKIVNGADTMTLSADNAFRSQIITNNNLNISVAHAAGGPGSLGVGGPDTGQVWSSVADPNGINLSRYGIEFGRHAGQTASGPTVIGPTGFWSDIHADEAATSPFRVIAQHAWSQAATGANQTGANITIAPGIGRRLITISDYTVLGGKTATITVNGSATTKTEGVNWTAGTSNGATATSLATALSAIPNVFATAVGAVVYIQPIVNSITIGPVYNFVVATNSASAPVTSGADGFIQTGTAVTAASVAAAFSATHYIPIKDGLGTTYYLPVDSASW